LVALVALQSYYIFDDEKIGGAAGFVLGGNFGVMGAGCRL